MLALRQRFLEKSKAECRDIARRALRAQCWYEQNKDATAELVVKQTGSSLEYVHACMDNEHYRLNLDPYPISVERVWSWMGEMGITDGLIRFSVGLEDAEDLSRLQAGVRTAVGTVDGKRDLRWGTRVGEQGTEVRSR